MSDVSTECENTEQANTNKDHEIDTSNQHTRFKKNQTIRWKYRNVWGRGTIKQIHRGITEQVVYICESDRGFWWAVPESCAIDLVEGW